MVSLFTTQTPSGNDFSDASPGITVGTAMKSSVDGTVTDGRFYATATISSATYTARLYEVTGDDTLGSSGATLLGSGTIPHTSVTPNAWNNIPLSVPVHILAGTPLRIAIHNDAGRYVFLSGLFNSDLVNDVLTGPANGSNPFGFGAFRQCTFSIDSTPRYPTDSGNGAAYFADLVFVPDGVASPKGKEFFVFF